MVNYRIYRRLARDRFPQWSLASPYTYRTLQEACDVLFKLRPSFPDYILIVRRVLGSRPL